MLSPPFSLFLALSLSPLASPAPLLAAARRNSKMFWSTPVLFELTSFRRYERDSVRLHRLCHQLHTSGAYLDLHPVRVYASASVHRRASPTGEQIPMKFAGPTTSFAERRATSGGTVKARARDGEQQVRNAKKEWRSSSRILARGIEHRVSRGIVMSPRVVVPRFRYYRRRCWGTRVTPSAVHLALLSSVLQQARLP